MLFYTAWANFSIFRLPGFQYGFFIMQIIQIVQQYPLFFFSRFGAPDDSSSSRVTINKPIFFSLCSVFHALK